MFKLFSILIIFSNKVISWSCTGHMITAKIAELTLENSQAFQQFEQSVLSLNSLTNGKSNTFIESACWADDIKGTGMNFWDNWHFINREINPDGIVTPQPANTNILIALDQVQKVLNNKSINTTSLQKAMMSRFLVHLIGDIHQPLHVVALFNDTYSQGDQGGNLFNISLTTKKIINLHSYWDQTFSFYHQDFKRPLLEKDQSLIEQYARQIIQDFPQSQLQNELQETNTTKWVNKEFHLAENDVYGDFLRSDSNQVTEDYKQNGIKIIQKQIALGGYRLSQIINNITQQQTTM